MKANTFRNMGATVVLLAGAAGGTLALTAVPGDAHADPGRSKIGPVQSVPCDPLTCPPDHEVIPPEQVAIGRDRVLSVAQHEAEDLAAGRCVGRAFDVVHAQPQLLPHGSWRYTLTYRCG